MQQYFENRKSIKSEEITSNKVYENIILANERVDKKWNSKNFIINNSTFAKMGFREACFSNDNLMFNVFIDCYFKRARFEDVNLTGCSADTLTETGTGVIPLLFVFSRNAATCSNT